jgi:hypothetical protein
MALVFRGSDVFNRPVDKSNSDKEESDRVGELPFEKLRWLEFEDPEELTVNPRGGVT